MKESAKGRFFENIPKVEDDEYGVDDSSDKEDGKLNGRACPPKGKKEHMPREELVNVSVGTFLESTAHGWLLTNSLCFTETQLMM